MQWVDKHLRGWLTVRTAPLVLAYVLTVTVTLAISGALGQLASVIDSFFGIGLVIVIRSRLHDAWGYDFEKLLLLVLVGSVGVFAVNLHHPHVAVASLAAFVAANAVATTTYVPRSPLMSYVSFAVVDSFVFPLIAFYSFAAWVVVGQIIAKILGALVYTWLFKRYARVPR